MHADGLILGFSLTLLLFFVTCVKYAYMSVLRLCSSWTAHSRAYYFHPSAYMCVVRSSSPPSRFLIGCVASGPLKCTYKYTSCLWQVSIMEVVLCMQIKLFLIYLWLF